MTSSFVEVLAENLILNGLDKSRWFLFEIIMMFIQTDIYAASQ